jgi:ribonuclease D
MDAVAPVIKLHKNDLPADLVFPNGVAIDSETMGLNPHRDRLCVVQLSAGDGNAHLVQFDGKDWSAPRLKALLADPAVLKIFHFARFDMAMLEQYLGVQQQSSDWGADKLSDQQKHYAASDVLHLHALKAKLDAMLQREGRLTEAEACFGFLGTRASLDLAGFAEMDIFAH